MQRILAIITSVLLLTSIPVNITEIQAESKEEVSDMEVEQNNGAENEKNDMSTTNKKSDISNEMKFKEERINSSDLVKGKEEFNSLSGNDHSPATLGITSSEITVWYGTFLSDTEVVITGYEGTAPNGHLDVPVVLYGTDDGKRRDVVGIGDWAFSDEGLTSVTIPNSTITSIGDYAFRGNKLGNITIPNNVTSLGEGSFYDNELKTVSIGSGIIDIEDWVFSHNQITNLTLGNNVKTIGLNAFQSSNLTTINLPSGLHTIGDRAFFNNELTALSIPSNVQTIGDLAFQNNNITSITIPNNVRSLGDSAFYNNELKTVNIGSGIGTIEDWTFSHNKITSLTLGSNVKSIGLNAFQSSSLTTINLPSGLHTIGDRAFFNNELATLTIPSSMTTIGDRAFTLNSIKNTTLPVGITSSGVSSFSSNLLESIYIMNPNMTIGASMLASNPGVVDVIAFNPSTARTYANQYTNYNFVDIEGAVRFSPNGNTDWSNIGLAISVSPDVDRSKPMEIAFSRSESTPTEGWRKQTIGNMPLTQLEGISYLHFRGTNLLGEKFSIRSNAFRIDRTAPTMAITPNTTTYTNSNVALTVNGLDTHSGIKRVRIANGTWVNGSTTTQNVSSNGTYSFEVEDNAGNTRTQSISINNIDKTKPTINLSENGGDYTRSHSTTINASDSGSGIDKVEYSWTTSSDFPSSDFTTISSGDSVSAPTSTGSHYLHIKATDKASNVRELTSSAFKIDRTNPTEPIISAPTNWQNSNVFVTIKNGSDSHSGVDKTEYRINGGSWTTYSGSISVSIDGETKIEARTIDKVGNISGTVSTTIKVDKDKPTLIITPSTTSTTHEDVILTVKGSDSRSGVKRIRQSGDSSWTTGNSITATITKNGTYTFEVEDNAGNTHSESISISNIDKTSSFAKPSISSFDSTTLGENAKTITTNVTPINIKDWRDDSNKWRLDVSANQMKLVGQSHLLPKGSMKLKPVSNIERVSGSGSMPTNGFTSTQTVDNGQTAVVIANGSRGEYNITFPSNALEVILDPTTAKTGTYESTITWEFVNAP